MHDDTREITDIIMAAGEKARRETKDEPDPVITRTVEWPLTCTVGPGLEGAIACESRIGYVNGAKGWLIYRGYDIFDLCANSTYEEVSYLLMYGVLPSASQLAAYKKRLIGYRMLNKTLRLLMGFEVETMNAMSALRLGTNLMRQEFTFADQEQGKPATGDAIGSDEDSIPMETTPRGEKKAIYEFYRPVIAEKDAGGSQPQDPSGLEACFHILAGVATITAAIGRVRQNRMPVEPDPELSHAANLLYMLCGKKPSPLEERIMDVALILHADHGMNASTFATMVVASTLSDIYLSVGAGIAALHGPLHGGANEEVIRTLMAIGEAKRVSSLLDEVLARKGRIPGFGHRVYKAYDPRARILGPLAQFLVEHKRRDKKPLFDIAQELEREMRARLGAEKKIFPNVDFFSGIVYSCLDIAPDMFTTMFAVSRTAGWTARVMEYLQHNRIFRPRAMYIGEFNNKYVPLTDRAG